MHIFSTSKEHMLEPNLNIIITQKKVVLQVSDHQYSLDRIILADVVAKPCIIVYDKTRFSQLKTHQ
ncbi:hypothetical protein GCM10011445_07490 [Pseudocitrobacter faecalis]|nr:hypothetical protein GCM10011445_07490 [Pseudocitrobacter faecalis]